MRKEEAGQKLQGKAEDADGPVSVKDGNAALQFLDRRTFRSIFENCYKVYPLSRTE